MISPLEMSQNSSIIMREASMMRSRKNTVISASTPTPLASSTSAYSPLRRRTRCVLYMPSRLNTNVMATL